MKLLIVFIEDAVIKTAVVRSPHRYKMRWRQLHNMEDRTGNGTYW